MAFHGAGVWERKLAVSTGKTERLLSLGTRLREERERLGYSQPKLGELLGVTKQTVFAWETGRTAPDGFHLMALSAAGFDVAWVVIGERDGAGLSAKEKALVGNYRALRPNDQDAAHTLLDSLAKPKSLKKAG